jgi:hypothetical protein
LALFHPSPASFKTSRDFSVWTAARTAAGASGLGRLGGLK